jgi:hypothetical protein
MGNNPASDGVNTYSYDPSGGLLGIGRSGVSVLAFVDQHTDVVGDFTVSGAALSGTRHTGPAVVRLANTGWITPPNNRLRDHETAGHCPATSKLSGIGAYHQTETTYDLTINGLHTYYVGAGTTSVLVHNCDTVNPSQVRFTQDSVGAKFKSGHSVDETAEALGNGTLSPSDLDPIRLVEHEGSLYTLDNRRLVAFQKAGLDEVPYRMATAREIAREWKKEFTTLTDGIGILICGVGWRGPGS